MTHEALDEAAATGGAATRALRLAAALLLALLAACGGGSADRGAVQQPQAGVAQPGSIRLSLTDGHKRSCDLAHVWLTVERVELDTRPRDGPGALDITLSPPRRIDVATLGGGLLHELGVATLQAGHYRRLRLHLAPNTAEAPLANAVQADGREPVPLDVRRAVHDGIKVPLDLTAGEGQQVDLVLDFDACRSVVARRHGGYLLKPVLNVRPRTIDAHGERQVNRGGGWNGAPAVAGLEGGGFVVAWTRGTFPQDPGAEIVAQRFDASGAEVGGEVAVGAGDSRYQPDVAALAGGGFVVAWTGNEQSAIHSRRFDADGAPAGPQVRVDTSGRQPWQPAIAEFPDGSHVIAWSAFSDTGDEFDVYAQRFDANGERAGGEIGVNTSRAGRQLSPAVAPLPGGGFAVAWSWQSASLVHGEVHAQRFDASGARVGPETKINSDPLTAGPTAAYSVVAAPSAGGFVVAWMWADASDAQASSRLHWRRVDASGIPAGDQQLVATGPIGAPQLNWLEAASLADGGFVLTWTGFTDEDSTDVHAQRFDATGVALGAQGVVNTTVAGPQEKSDVAALGGGGFVVAWEWFAFDPDPVASDIFMQRFGPEGERQ